MKKLLFLIFFLFFTANLFSENLNVIKGKVVKVYKDSIEIFDLKTKKNEIINGKFLDLNTGDIVKIYFDNNKKMVKFRKIDLKLLRERIKKIGKFKHRYQRHKFNRGSHRHHR